MSEFWRSTSPVSTAVWPPVEPAAELDPEPAGPEPDPEPGRGEAAAAELLERAADLPPVEELTAGLADHGVTTPDAGDAGDSAETVPDSAETPGTLPVRPQFPGAHPQAAYDWPSIRRRYVEGVTDPKTGIVEWPSIAAAADAFGAPAQRAREHAAAQGWTAQRRAWQAEVDAARRATRARKIAKHAGDLEGKALDTAQLGLQLVYARLGEIAQEASRRRGENGGAGIDAQEQQRLAAAADLWHKIGLRALGDPEVTRVELTGAGGAPIEIAQELRRDNPTRLAGVLAVLQSAGIGDLVGDVVDGEVAEDD